MKMLLLLAGLFTPPAEPIVAPTGWQISPLSEEYLGGCSLWYAAKGSEDLIFSTGTSFGAEAVMFIDGQPLVLGRLSEKREGGNDQGIGEAFEYDFEHADREVKVSLRTTVTGTSHQGLKIDETGTLAITYGGETRTLDIHGGQRGCE